MANVYSTEPPTSGKVILKTNYGNVDIELWTKESPLACRNFIQLCIEGFYNNVIFHRIIKGFMIQTGDPSGTGNGGESIWDKDFQDEFHSRLRFSHRGIVAMANRNKSNSNGSQFFITLDRCSWLDKKHTIFGKVTGDTIFNAINISQLPTKDDFPINDLMPKIIKTEVIINPFIDIVPRKSKIDINKKRNVNNEENKIYDRKELQEKKMEKLTNTNLISFDSEEDERVEKNKPSFMMKPLPGLKEDKKNKKKVFDSEQDYRSKLEKIDEFNKNADNIRKISEMDKKQKYNYLELNLNEEFLQNGLDEDKILQYLQLKKNTEPNELNFVKKDLNIYNNVNERRVSSSSQLDSSSYEEEDNLQSEILRKKILEEKNLFQIIDDENKVNINFDFDKDRKVEMLKIKQDIQLIKKRIQNKNDGKDYGEDIDKKPKLTLLQEMRMKYLNNKRTKNFKEKNEKLNEFVKNLKTLSNQEGNWMNNKLKFHIDSQKAFNFNDTKEKVLRNFDLNK